MSETDEAGGKLTVGSLFAGIGGFDLGLERTGGFEIKWQVEIDEFCQRVLAKHWPHVKRYGDIRTVDRPPAVDVLCGGFPCQDISNAGKREGINGERSGLWAEFARLIRLVRPQFVIVENVAALLSNGIDRVLGDMAACWYDASWQIIPAVAIGAPHRRERVWIVAHASGRRKPLDITSGPKAWGSCGGNWWSTEPAVGRVAYGIPDRLDRLKGLGNAVVPQIVEWIGNQILAYERSQDPVSIGKEGV